MREGVLLSAVDGGGARSGRALGRAGVLEFAARWGVRRAARLRIKGTPRSRRIAIL